MASQPINLNTAVTTFLDGLNHPFRKEIEQLRLEILSAGSNLEENIKWNGPNYSFGKQDRITMKILPPKQVQLIFHRGAKVQEQPTDKLIQDGSGLLTWKENDRAVATFRSMTDIETRRTDLARVVRDWIKASS